MLQLQVEKHERIGELYHTTILNYRKGQTCKILLPQIVAAICVSSFQLTTGLSFAYSAILIPQLLEAQSLSSFNASRDVYVTESDCSWIASVFPIIAPIGSVAAGILMDSIGRINTFKLAALPGVVGWALIALASNVYMIIVGRMLLAISSAFGVCPAMVYATEIGRPDIRGSLTSIGTAMVSLGMMVGYLEGYFFSWRIVAWLGILYTLLLTTLITFIPESPLWLINKNQTNRALKSLEWLNRYHPMEDFANTQLILLQNEGLLKKTQKTDSSSLAWFKVKLFFQPAVYKPMIILGILYIFLNFSGIYITQFYAISFFQEVGVTISPYMVSVQMGATRFVMAIAALWLNRQFNRRTLVLTSALCMTICMGFSAYHTNQIKTGNLTLHWVPIAWLLLYTASTMIGFLSVPLIIIGELFPTVVRGVAHSIVYGLFNVLMFASVQSYYSLNRLCGGIVELQYFFAVVSLCGMLYSYIFLPETHNKRLSDIEQYFQRNTVYISRTWWKNKDQKESVVV